MLDQLADDLDHEDLQLLTARDIGPVGDVLRHATGDGSLTQVYPSVEAAVDAASTAARMPE